MILLEQNEQIIRIVRKHWFVFVTDIVSVFLLLFLPIAVAIIFYFIDQRFPISGDIFFLSLFTGSLILLFIWSAMFIMWTDYFLDILIITNKHVIDVDQRGLFDREISTFRLDRIQDITTEVNGLIPTFLKFGTIHIQTAGDDRDFLIRGVPKPFDVRHMISEQQSVATEVTQTVNLSSESLGEIKKTS